MRLLWRGAFDFTDLEKLWRAFARVAVRMGASEPKYSGFFCTSQA